MLFVPVIQVYLRLMKEFLLRFTPASMEEVSFVHVLFMFMLCIVLCIEPQVLEDACCF